MSDSLRDQLLKAGFSQSAKSDITEKDKAGKKRPSGKKRRTKREESAEASAKTIPSKRVYRPEDSVEKERLKKTRYRSVAPTGSKPSAKKAKKAPAVKARAGSWSSRSTVVDTQPASIQKHGQLRPRASENELPDETSLAALIRDQALNLDEADQLYRFSINNRITEINVTNTIRDGLLKAELGIARLHDKLFVVPAKVIEDIKRIQPELAVFLACDNRQPARESDDSGYDDFPVPDDLHW